jgi:hypothetical protein
MKVLEVGCGDEAGPFFDGAEERIILDLIEEAVAISANRDPRFTPMIGDATNLDEFANESMDVVLARNVFGSPLLGIEHKRMIRIMQSGWKSAEYKTVESEVDTRKIRIMHAAGRVLNAKGKLVIVEQLTPEVAREFFGRLETTQDTILDTLSFPQLVDISSVTPLNYVRKHQRHGGRNVWVSYRQP